MPPLILLGIELALDQGEDDDEDREESHHSEAEEGDVLVVDSPGGAYSVRCGRVGGEQEGEEGGQNCEENVAGTIHVPNGIGFKGGS